METIDDFIARSYIDFNHDIVQVFDSRKEKMKVKSKGEKWDIATARRYINILEKSQT